MYKVIVQCWFNRPASIIRSRFCMGIRIRIFSRIISNIFIAALKRQFCWVRTFFVWLSQREFCCCRSHKWSHWCTSLKKLSLLDEVTRRIFRLTGRRLKCIYSSSLLERRGLVSRIGFRCRLCSNRGMWSFLGKPPWYCQRTRYISSSTQTHHAQW